MATSFTSLLRLAQPSQGELSGTWGTVVNDNITAMVEEAIAGLATIDTWVANSATLSTANGTTDESRAAILKLTDTTVDLSGSGTLICPALTKMYIVTNTTGQQITVKTSGGTGIAIADDATSIVYCDGVNVLAGSTSSGGAITGTTIDDSIIGGTTPAAITGTTITGTTWVGLPASDVVDDTTPQLGGNLDVNGKTILSVSNGDIAITPNGTGDVILDGLKWPQADGTADYVLKTNGAGQLSWVAEAAGGISNVVDDTTPQLGGSLDVNGQSLVSVSNGDIPITPNGTGDIILDGLKWPQADGTADYVLKTNGSGQLSWAAAASSGGMSDLVDDLTPQLGGNLDVNAKSIVSVSNGDITLTPDGSGVISLDGTVTGPSGEWNSGGMDLATSDTYEINGTTVLSATSLGSGVMGSSLTSLGTLTSLTATTAEVGALEVTGEIVEAVYALSGTTPALNPANGTIQTWTLSGNSSPTDSLSSGESITLHIFDGTTYSITWPTMLWVGGNEPTLDPTFQTIIEVWKVNTTLFGALVGVAS